MPLLFFLFALLAGCPSQSTLPSESSPSAQAPAPPPAPRPGESAGQQPSEGGAAGASSDEESVADPASPTPAPSGQKRWLGLPVATMKEPITGAAPDERCFVDRALRGGPAWVAGIRAKDVLVSANGSPVKICKDYLTVARTVALGGSIRLGVKRDGKVLDFNVDVVEQPSDEVAFRKAAFPGTESFGFDLPALRPGGRASTKDARGKVQVLYFWATWCGPCRQTAPMVEALWKELGPSRVFVAAISNEERPVIERYLATSTNSYPVLHDESSDVKRGYEVSKLPTIVLVGKDGRVVRWETSVSGVRSVLDEARALAGSASR